MTTQRNPENQQKHRPHDLGQISEGRNPNPWVLVEQAGTDDESIREDFATFRGASLAMKNYYYWDELETLNVQIMRRRDDGVLTTEY